VSIGEALADAREQAGLSVLQVSERTRIRPSIIRNIEADDYSKCGGDFYARGDIRSIAEVVGADPMPLIQEYDQRYRAAGPVSATSLDELLRTTAQPERPRRSGRLVVLGLALVVAAGIAGFFLWGYHPGAGSGPSVAANDHPSGSQAASGHPGNPAAASSAPATAEPSPSPSAPAPAPAHPRVRMLDPVIATGFRPHGGRGDNPQNAHLAIDGRPRTAWRTDWYTTPQFGNLYRGTGLLLDMGHKVTITGVRVLLGPPAGARFQIRVGPRPRLAALRTVAHSAGPGGMVYLRVGSRPEGRYVLVWFTKLPPNAASNFQVAVRGVRVRGWK
jgi:transcriptional regulator with XRE-family HTH domain